MKRFLLSFLVLVVTVSPAVAAIHLRVTSKFPDGGEITPGRHEVFCKFRCTEALGEGLIFVRKFRDADKWSPPETMRIEEGASDGVLRGDVDFVPGYTYWIEFGAKRCQTEDEWYCVGVTSVSCKE